MGTSVELLKMIFRDMLMKIFETKPNGDFN